MEARKIAYQAYQAYQGTRLAVFSALVFCLFVLPFPETGRSEESPPNDAAQLKNDAAQLKIEDEEFVFVSGKAILIEDHYVLALYKNAEKGHYAIALLTARCGSDDCKIGDLVAYSIFDDQGDDVQVASYPRAENQTPFQPVFTHRP